MEEDELQSDQEDQVCALVRCSHRTPQADVLPLQEPVASGSSPSKLAKMQHSAERQQKKQKRMADESQLHAKRQEMDKAKVPSSLQFYVSRSHTAQISDAVKRYSYLLGQTDLFKYFVDIKASHVHLCPVSAHPFAFSESSRSSVCCSFGCTTKAAGQRSQETCVGITSPRHS